MIREYSKYKPFRFWCQKVLPLVYDDSLSYYELLNKVVDYLNNVIKDVNALGTAFEELDAMVNDYFDNLDVQEEINNKLDSMAEDGTLDAMILPLVGDAVSDWLEDNVTPTGSAVVVDASLTISGASADAKVTGDEIGDLKSDLQPLQTAFIDIVKTKDGYGVDTTNLIEEIKTGYYTTSAGILSYNDNPNFSYAEIDVTDIERIYIDGTHHIYTTEQFNALGVFVNSENVAVISIVNQYGGLPNTPYSLNVPDGATKLYLNCDYKKADYPSSVPSSFICYPYRQREVYYVPFEDGGKELRIIAGVIRNRGNGWEFIEDSGHEPLNLSSVSVNENGQIVLDYGFTAKKVLSLVVSPDETFAKTYSCGASVGLSESIINVYSLAKSLGGLVKYNASSGEWDTANSDFTSATFATNGNLTLAHEDLTGYPLKDIYSVSADGNGGNVQITSIGYSSMIVRFIDASGNTITSPVNNTSVYAIRSLNSRLINANDIVSTGGNFWIFGIMEI